MRNRVLLSAGAIALVAASCAQPEPQVLSEAPRSASSSELTSPTATTDERDEQPGRFIARCATEADGGTPGMTIFTDGSQNVTDHCLSRYYIGVQPAPGALYVPDEEAGTFAPQTDSSTVQPTGEQWTPAQPRTDIDPLAPGVGDEGSAPGDESTTDRPDEPGGDETDPSTPGSGEPGSTTPGTSPDETTPTSPSPTTPGGGEPGLTEPGLPDLGDPTSTLPSPTGSSEPTSVPTGADTRQLPTPAPPVAGTPTQDAGSLGSAGPDESGESQTSVRIPAFRWPGSFWPGGPPTG